MSDNHDVNVCLVGGKGAQEVVNTPLLAAIDKYCISKNPSPVHMDIIVKLLIHGADPNVARTKDNMTPLIALALCNEQL